MDDLGDWQNHLQFLAWLFAKLRPKRGLELGVCAGVSLSVLARLAPYCRWDGVDRWGETGNAEYQAIQNTHSLNVTLYRATFQAYRKHLPKDHEPYDVIHIDGLHDYFNVTADLQIAKSLLSPNGIILMHDINHPYSEVRMLWQEIKDKHPYLESPSECGLGAFNPNVIFSSNITLSLLA